MKITTANSAQLATALALAALLVSEVEASKKFVKMIPNGGNVPDTPAIGHPDGTGKSAATNAFGDAFSEAGNKWTKELCEADTDGDGQTNGQELGDPCCEWDMNTHPVVQWTTGVSHPDDASKTSDPSLWANLCGASTTESTTSTDSASAATSSEPESAPNGSGATRTPSESTEVDETSAHSSATSSENSTGSSSDTQTHDSDDSSHTHSASFSNSNSSNASDTGSMNTSDSISSDVEVGSPSAFDESSKSTIRGTSSANSAASSASTPSTSSSSSATSGASIVNPLFATAAGVLAVTMAFFA